METAYTIAQFSTKMKRDQNGTDGWYGLNVLRTSMKEVGALELTKFLALKNGLRLRGMWSGSYMIMLKQCYQSYDV